MSDEQQLDNSDFGRPGIEKAQGFEPMVVANPVDRGDELPLTPDELAHDGSSVARHLSRDPARDFGELTERTYLDVQTGARKPENEVVSDRQAASDLAAVRSAEREAIERQQNAELEQAIDDLRRQALHEATGQSPAQTNDAARAAMAQQEQEYPDPDLALQPEYNPAQAEAVVAEADQKIAEFLKDPFVRERVEREFGQVQQQAATEVQQARTAYQHGLAQNAATALAVLTVDFPEYSGLSGPQLEGALRVSNPQRVEAFRQRVNQVNAVVANYQQVVGQQQQQFREQQMQQQQRAAQEFELYKREQGKKVDAAIPLNDPIRNNVFELTERHYGIPEAQMRALASDPHLAPLIHSAEFQMILYEGLKAREVRQSLAAHRATPVPQVQRPGVSQPRSSDDGAYAAVERQFRGKDLSAKQAADLLIARRAARS